MALSSQVSEAKHCPTPTKPGTLSNQPRARGAVTTGESQPPNQAVPTPQMSLHPRPAAASLLWLSVLTDPSLSSSQFESPARPPRALPLGSQLYLALHLQNHSPLPSSGKFPKHAFGAKALHACESSPPRLATSCLGESRERKDTQLRGGGICKAS